ncbi:MAG TPA: GNAT family N-acetyltransferase [Sporichthya sp.]|nr:GNAT family N-acetyltransferase [Sporichthya sp.]
MTSAAQDLASTPVAARRSADVTLADGTRLLLRPIVPSDKDLLREAFERLSPRSRYRRFFAPMNGLSSSMLRMMTEVDYTNQFAWVALACEDERTQLVGVARFVRLADPRAADVALVVVDPYQGRGIGTLLLDALVLEALRGGICRLEGMVLADNVPMRTVLADAEARFSRDDEPGTVHFEIDLPARAVELREHPLGDVLRRLARGEAELYRAEPCPWVIR